MRAEIRKLKTWFSISIGCIGLSSASLLMIPFADFRGSPPQKAIGYVIGTVFWAGIIAGYIIFWLLSRSRKQIPSNGRCTKPRIGIISFFRTFTGMIADVICGLSLIGLVIAIAVAGDHAGWFTFLLIAVFIFSLQMHSILNGENYINLEKLKWRGTK
jgi:hypothetical protein